MHRSVGRPVARGSLLVALSIAVLFHARPVSAQPESPAGLVTPLVDAGHLAGAVVLVTGPDAVVVEEAIGMADRERGRAMTADTLFWIASMTKPITAAAVMILVDEGKIALDDPVAKTIPEFQDLWVIAERRGVWMVQDAGSPPEWRRAKGDVRQWAFERFGATDR